MEGLIAFMNSRKLSWLLRLLLICGGDATCGGDVTCCGDVTSGGDAQNIQSSHVESTQTACFSVLNADLSAAPIPAVAFFSLTTLGTAINCCSINDDI